MKRVDYKKSYLTDLIAILQEMSIRKNPETKYANLGISIRKSVQRIIESNLNFITLENKTVDAEIEIMELIKYRLANTFGAAPKIVEHIRKYSKKKLDKSIRKNKEVSNEK